MSAEQGELLKSRVKHLNQALTVNGVQVMSIDVELIPSIMEQECYCTTINNCIGGGVCSYYATYFETMALFNGISFTASCLRDAVTGGKL